MASMLEDPTGAVAAAGCSVAVNQKQKLRFLPVQPVCLKQTTCKLYII